MNREEFIRRLEELHLPKTEYVILSGGSLLLRGLRESTADLDISVSGKLAEKLDLYRCPKDEHGLYMPYGDVQMKDDKEFFRVEMVDGYPCETLEQILEQKKQWNRQKDQKDIAVIMEYFAHHKTAWR